uniref:Transmembrane protein n=1 Tax=Strongyloides venezuelensis TaxID=75913 RepID=A0A0K0FPG4_STRVS
MAEILLMRNNDDISNDIEEDRRRENFNIKTFFSVAYPVLIAVMISMSYTSFCFMYVPGFNSTDYRMFNNLFGFNNDQCNVPLNQFYLPLQRFLMLSLSFLNVYGFEILLFETLFGFSNHKKISFITFIFNQYFFNICIFYQHLLSYSSRKKYFDDDFQLMIICLLASIAKIYFTLSKKLTIKKMIIMPITISILSISCIQSIPYKVIFSLFELVYLACLNFIAIFCLFKVVLSLLNGTPFKKDFIQLFKATKKVILMLNKKENNDVNDQEEDETKEELYINSFELFIINYTFGFTILKNDQGILISVTKHTVKNKKRSSGLRFAALLCFIGYFGEYGFNFPMIHRNTSEGGKTTWEAIDIC